MKKLVTKKKSLIILGVILFLAAFLRLWQIGTVPIAPDWDEAALGYNAYSIMLTGKDEHGKFLPIVLESFGDYKPGFYTYLIIPFIQLFDLTVLAVRLPSALAGIIAVFLTYLLVKELLAFSTNKQNTENSYPNFWALTVALLLAISPWHIQFSRVAFESNVAITFNLAGILFFFKGLKQPKLLCFTSLFFALSLSTYQSEKLFVPLLGIILISIFWRELFALPKKYLFASVVVFSLIAFPILVFTLTDEHGLARANSVSFFSDKTALLQNSIEKLERDRATNDMLGLIFDNRRVVYAKAVIAGYLSHFDLNWLFIKGDAVGRHHAPFMGLLYLVELPFLLIGLYVLIWGNRLDRRVTIFLLLWFLSAPIPASITTGVPHAVRTLNFLPTFQIITALGLLTALLWISTLKYTFAKIPVKYATISFVVLIFFFNFFYYLNQYFVQQNYYFAKEWQFGYKELVDTLKPIHNNYEKIIVSNQGDFDQSYIFFLFYLKHDPKQYQLEGGTKIGGNQVNKIDNFEFRAIDAVKEEGNALLVGSTNEFNDKFKQRTIIKYPDGTDAMVVVEKK